MNFCYQKINILFFCVHRKVDRYVSIKRVNNGKRPMTHEDILREILSLPLKGQRQVIDFIAFIRQRYHQSQLPESNIFDVCKENFIGIWQDRNDLKDSTDWIRRARETEWRK